MKRNTATPCHQPILFILLIFLPLPLYLAQLTLYIVLLLDFFFAAFLFRSAGTVLLIFSFACVSGLI